MDRWSFNFIVIIKYELNKINGIWNLLPKLVKYKCDNYWIINGGWRDRVQLFIRKEISKIKDSCIHGDIIIKYTRFSTQGTS